MTAGPQRVVENVTPAGDIALVRWLALGTLLVVSHGATRSLALGLAALLALVTTSTLAAALRRWTPQESHLAVFLMLIAAIVASIELVLRAWRPELHAAIGPFLPLIALCGALMVETETSPAPSAPRRSALDGLAPGFRALSVLLAVGMVRELVGSGRLFFDAGRLLHAPWLEWHPLPGFDGLPLAMLPFGAFLALACLLALRQAWQQGRSAKP